MLGYWGDNQSQAYFNGWISNPGTAADGTPYIWSAESNGGIFQDNGTTSNLVNLGSAVGHDGPNEIALGGQGNTGEPSTGNVGELLIYPSDLSPAQFQQTENYLLAKWFGLNVAGASALPTATPVSVAAGATLDLNGNNQQVLSLTDYNGGGGTVTNSSAVPASLTLRRQPGRTSSAASSATAPPAARPR